MKQSGLMSYILRSLTILLGSAWLLACILLPINLYSAADMPDTRQAVVPLPIAPVKPPDATNQTPWLTPHIVGYRAHLFAAGEDLASVAQQGGSDELLIKAYNHIPATPPVGRPLIVPHLAGYDNTLPLRTLLITRGHSEQPWVALTLDAGAGSAPVPAILDTLRARNVRITFFLTGAWINENPDLTRQMVADGHEIANHSYTHADFTTLSEAAMIEELEATERLLQQVAGTSTRPYFRPPYGAYSEQVLLTTIEQGYMPIYWTLDSLDSVGEPKTPDFLVERITGTLSPEELRGSIILAHCGSQATADALPEILDRFAAMDLEVRTLSEVLGQ